MKKIAYALLAIIIAVGLWCYVIAVESPDWVETYYDIPVILENESVLHGKGLMTMVKDTPKVTLKLQGSRSDFSNLNKENITVVADLARIYSAGKQWVSYTVSVPGSNGIEVIDKNPQVIELTVTERSSKDVPVELVYEGAVPEGFQTDRENLTLDNRTVRVTGPASVINKIATARIVVDLEGQTETINQSYTYTLCDKNGEPVDAEQVNTNITEIKLNLKIQRYKDIQLMLTPVFGGGANIKNTTISMDMTTIQVSGTEQQLEEMGDVLDLGEIRLYEIASNTVQTIDIKLPEGVENLTGKDTVSVSIQFQGVVTRTIYVSRIEAQNVPEGLEAKIIAKQLEVVVRGPKAQVDAISADALMVQVDFTNAEVGQKSYKATVYVDSKIFGDVGAVGVYHMYCNVSEAEAEEVSGES